MARESASIRQRTHSTFCSNERLSFNGIFLFDDLLLCFFAVHLGQAAPAIEEALVFHHFGDQFPDMPATITLKQDAFAIGIQSQHKSSSKFPVVLGVEEKGKDGPPAWNNVPNPG
jgi:hypothetical protein